MTDMTEATRPDPLLATTSLLVRYGSHLALDGISLTVEPKSAVAVVGANGAGKSSLARAVSGLIAPAAGTVSFEDHDISGWNAYRIRRAGIVHLPEGRGVFPGLTVTENLKMAVLGLPRRARGAATAKALDLFPQLADRRGTRAGMLSGGEQQMLSLARALAVSPRLIVADELSLGLAPKMVDLVFESLAILKSQGVAILLIEQYIHRAVQLADTCVLLQRGRIAWQGTAESAREEVVARYLGENDPATPDRRTQ